MGGRSLRPGDQVKLQAPLGAVLIASGTDLDRGRWMDSALPDPEDARRGPLHDALDAIRHRRFAVEQFRSGPLGLATAGKSNDAQG